MVTFYRTIFFVLNLLFQILFRYICLQISRLVGLFGIEGPKQKVEFQIEMFLYVFLYSIFCNKSFYLP